MKPIVTSYLIAIFLFCKITGLAQTDTITLTYKSYLNNIINHHPSAKQANLKRQFAEAEMLAAKGNLDPEINADWREKNFDEKLYP